MSLMVMAHCGLGFESIRLLKPGVCLLPLADVRFLRHPSSRWRWWPCVAEFEQLLSLLFDKGAWGRMPLVTWTFLDLLMVLMNFQESEGLTTDMDTWCHQGLQCSKEDLELLSGALRTPLGPRLKVRRAWWLKVPLFFIFWQSWGLNLGPQTCKALPLEP
jgi:hypothetical protein